MTKFRRALLPIGLDSAAPDPYLSPMPVAQLDRSVFRLTGEGVIPWLDGLISNSLSGPLTFAALLTPQGKIIADFFVTKHVTELRIDTPTKFATDLFKRLRMYKLRAPIEIEDISDKFSVYVSWDDSFEFGVRDPRHASLGFRKISASFHDTEGTIDQYNAHRLSLGVVDSEWDFETVTTFPADANMDLMNGVDFKKGCFVGQEVVSRMKRMTTVKKRMRGLKLSGKASAGDKIMAGERVIGEILHVSGPAGIGLIRLNRLSEANDAPSVNSANISIMDAPGEPNS